MPVTGHDVALSLRRSYLTLHRRADQLVADLDLTADQFAVLTELAVAAGIIQRELVDRLASDANTIAAILRRLEERGWVRRDSSPEDARSKRVWLTTAGRTLQRRAAGRMRVLWSVLKASSGTALVRHLQALERRLSPEAIPLQD
jgi:DNA-binding MarR family transcriptional regulator